MEVITSRTKIDLGILDRYARLLDSSIQVPGTDRSFGLDPILGLIPVLGSFAGFGFSTLLLLKTLQLGASKRLLALMFGNIILDATVGAIPLIGTLFDFYYKANERNLKLFREHHEEGKHKESILPLFIAFTLIGLGMIFAILYILYQTFVCLF